MTQDEFRKAHSYLIEQYQYIEMYLESVYACLAGKDFCMALEDVEKANIHRLLVDIHKLDAEETVFNSEEYKLLRELNDNRNFWVHRCYPYSAFDTTGAPKKTAFVERLLQDTRTSEKMKNMIWERLDNLH